MRIADVRTIKLSRLHERERQWVTDRYRSVKADACLVLITDETGATGVGEACSYGGPRKIEQWVTWYARTLIGSDIDDWRKVPTPVGSALSSAHDYAVAGIDCALWDLRGKRAGLPVRQLLSDSSDQKVHAYASTGVTYDWDDPRGLAEDIARQHRAGYSLVKVRLGTSWEWNSIRPSNFLALLDDAIAPFRDKLKFAVDGNCRLSLGDAFELGYGLSQLGCEWFEEPVCRDDVAGYARLNQELSVPITGGESWSSQSQFQVFLDAGAYAAVQPDAGVCGLTELIKIGRVAASYGVDLIPHSWHNGAMAMANAHAVAALPNAHIVEECRVQGPLQWSILKGGSAVLNGEIELSSVGLGIELAAGLENKFPFIEGHYSVTVDR